MTYIFLAVLCSVLVSVLLKLARRQQVDVGQAIAWNYVATSLLTAWIFHPSMAILQGPGVPWVGLIGLGVLLPAIFLALATSVRHAGIVRSDAAQRLSLLISLLAAFLLFGEAINATKLAGIVLGLVALFCMVWRSGGDNTGNGKEAWLWPVVVLAGFAAIDILFKHVAQAGTPFAVSLQAMFALALVVSFAIQIGRRLRGQMRFSLRSALGGLLLGLANFGNIVFYVRAHQALPQQPALVFSAMNLGVVALGALVGTLVFREKLSRLNFAGVALAVAAIALATRA
ncbi:EamA family transporter [Dyella koreensis]|uniref:EamA family transporter n=1 Tax=Dyella koreensis TaxID=311235 RepID=A0ABW8K364_9GAMM